MANISAINITEVNQTATSITAKISELLDTLDELIDEVSRIPVGAMEIPEITYEKTASLIDRIIAAIKRLLG